MNETRVLEFNDTTRDPAVRGFLHRSEKSSGDGLVLTHGAGANCHSALLRTLASKFAEAGVTVLRCDLPFRQKRPSGPPMRGSAERDQQGLRSAVEAIRREVPGRIFLGGHSYGGRQATMLAASDPEIADGLLLLSYPLHPPKKLDQMRTAHFPALRTPTLFVQGSRDGMGTSDEVQEALKLIPARTELLTVLGAGHELITARTADEVTRQAVDAFSTFLARTGVL